MARRSTDHNILVLHPWNSQVVIPPIGTPPAPSGASRRRGPPGGCTRPCLHPEAARETPIRQPTTSSQSAHNALTTRPHFIHRFPTFRLRRTPSRTPPRVAVEHDSTARHAPPRPPLPEPDPEQKSGRNGMERDGTRLGPATPSGRRRGDGATARGVTTRQSAGRQVTALQGKKTKKTRGRRRQGPVAGEPVTGPGRVRENSRGH